MRQHPVQKKLWIQLCALGALILLLLLMLSRSAKAGAIPVLTPGMPMPELQVYNEKSEEVPLSTVFDAPGGSELPRVLVPIYTRCRMSCPVLVSALVKASTRLKDPRLSYRVVLLSFDATDNEKDLREFRKREEIPRNWAIVRATDEASVRNFFDAYSYSIMSQLDMSGGFDHPSEVFFLDRRSRWAATLAGTDIRSQDLRDALEAAVSSGSGQLWRTCKAAIGHPETLVIIGASGFTLTLLFLVCYVSRRRRPLSAT